MTNSSAAILFPLFPNPKLYPQSPTKAESDPRFVVDGIDYDHVIIDYTEHNYVALLNRRRVRQQRASAEDPN